MVHQSILNQKLSSMKTKLFFIFILLCAKVTHGQIVVSSCLAPDSVIEKYQDDADRLTVKRIVALNSIYKDSVKISKMWSDTTLNALVAVYNATSLPARNTVVNLNIHTWPNLTLRSVIVSADSNQIWMHQLHNNVVPTGYNTFDNMMGKYNLNLISYNDNSQMTPFHQASFQSDSNLNILALSDMFATLNGVVFSSPNNGCCDGDDIQCFIYPSFVKLIYSKGWNDCPSGCINRHYWEFKVYYDCSVEFVGEYGSPYSPTTVQEIQEDVFNIYPNPAKNQFVIYTNSLDKNIVDIYDIAGKHIFSETVIGKTLINVDNFENGIYTLVIKNGTQIINKKLMIAR